MKISPDILHFANDFALGDHKVRIKRMHWDSRFDFPFYSFKSSLVVDGSEVVGSGSAFDEESALRKSVAELFERCCFKLEKSRTSSSGFAVHRTLEEAALHASLELIERDLFMCSYLTKIPILDYTEAACLACEEFRNIRDVLSRTGSELRLGLMHESEGLFSVLCICFEPLQNTGCIVGASCKVSLREAIKAALSEVLINYLAVQNNPCEPMDETEFLGQNAVDLQYHFRLGLHPDTGRKMKSLLSKKVLPQREGAKYFSSMVVQEIEKKNNFSQVPLVFCKATNIDLQPMKFGIIVPDDINFARLASFAGRDVDFSSLETYPHPFY